MANKLIRLYEEFGQSMWYDNISRAELDAGEIQSLVDSGIRGLTSNPSIFQKAITSGTAYDAQFAELVQQGLGPVEIYEAMAVEDIRRAADILRPIYDESGGEDGYVSLEVSPLLANDTQGTIEEAARLFKMVDRPNLMIKIPATDAGLPAIEESIASGINVNVTLLFSCDMYARVMDAYIRGLERRAGAGEDISRVASVASFFVSRVDTMIDDMLDAKIAETDDPARQEELRALKGKAGIANAQLAYKLFVDRFKAEDFRRLAERGAKIQRLLWGSTSTKNPDYSDVLYVDNLIGPNTINTAPPETIKAFVDHGALATTLTEDVSDAEQVMQALAREGIDIDAVTDKLLQDGVEKFVKPFNSLLESIAEKARATAGTTAD
ncbi:MAG TPA: transaldolase [Aggregatilineales bacterium]|nr:transaldolase [Chloroflexota bacterium]HOA23911.1 transaldolase [Aggregatilineales bacterium]HPV05976.1 transaldolase [Aggregatilineales bacterium]HQE19742.1 transaldolase [Aggregatilineales bacterium]